MAGYTYKLYYFDIQGKGEPIRLFCHYAGLPLEDIRLSREEFQQMKANGKLRFGQLPALEVIKEGQESVIITQCNSILRFLGKQVPIEFDHCYPKDDLKAAYVESILDQENDFTMGLGVSIYKERFGYGVLNDNKELLLTIRKSINDEVLPRHCQFFENLIIQGGTGWLAGGNGPSIAEFLFAPRLTWMFSGNQEGIDKTMLERYPNLKGMVDKFYALPSITAYYKK